MPPFFHDITSNQPSQRLYGSPTLLHTLATSHVHPPGHLLSLAPELRQIIYAYVLHDINPTTLLLAGANLSTITRWRNRDTRRSDRYRLPPPRNPAALAQTCRLIHDELQTPLRERAYSFDVDHDCNARWSCAGTATGFPAFVQWHERSVPRMTITNVVVDAETGHLPREVKSKILVALLNWGRPLLGNGNRVRLPVIDFFGQNHEVLNLQVVDVRCNNHGHVKDLHCIWGRQYAERYAFEHFFFSLQRPCRTEVVARRECKGEQQRLIMSFRFPRMVGGDCRLRFRKLANGKYSAQRLGAPRLDYRVKLPRMPGRQQVVEMISEDGVQWLEATEGESDGQGESNG